MFYSFISMSFFLLVRSLFLGIIARKFSLTHELPNPLAIFWQHYERNSNMSHEAVAIGYGQWVYNPTFLILELHMKMAHGISLVKMKCEIKTYVFQNERCHLVSSQLFWWKFEVPCVLGVGNSWRWKSSKGSWKEKYGQYFWWRY